jgi:hypothetical protein
MVDLAPLLEWDVLCETKVDDLNVPVLVHQEVLRLQIAVSAAE